MRVLITGGAGFIGSHLCEHFIQTTNHEVICMDNLSSGRRTNIDKFLGHKQFTFLEADINTHIFSNEFVVDEIYHMACPASPQFYQKDPLRTLQTNFVGTSNMLILATHCKAKMLFTSTSEVYGSPKFSPQQESYWGNVNPVGPRSCYDEGKRIAETLCIEYHKAFGTKVHICRIFNTYGPNLDPEDGRVVSNFLKQAERNEPITIYGTGEQTRSFCYVTDLINGFIKLMSSEYYMPVNLGNPNEMTIRELAKVIIDLTKSKSKIEYKPLPQDDPERRNPDISLAKSLLGWEPKIGIEEGIVETLWQQRHGGQTRIHIHSLLRRPSSVKNLS